MTSFLAAPASSAARVLVVEDESLVAMMLAKSFEPTLLARLLDEFLGGPEGSAA